MLSFSFLPRIIKPTHITPRSQTLIDNIFYTELDKNILADNITTDISDCCKHLIMQLCYQLIGDQSLNTQNLLQQQCNKLYI